MSTEITAIRFRDWLRQQVKDGATATCSCGRGFGRITGYRPLLDYQPHCPDCGSGWTMVKASASVLVKLEDDTIIDSAGVICRKCGCVFNQYAAFAECKAPPSKAMRKEIEDKAKGEALVEQITGRSVDDLKKQLLELRAKREESK